jgi:hypothetical protein
MTISNIRPGRPSAISRHLSISKWRLSCLATGLLAVAMSSDIAHSRGMGLKSGYVCPYGYDFRCFNGACNCYEDADQTKAKRDFIKRQKALKRVTNPCGTEPCSPGNKSQPSSDRRRSPESGGSSSSAIDRLGGGGTVPSPSGGIRSGGGAATRSTAGGSASSGTPGSSSSTMDPRGISRTSPMFGPSPGLR